MSRRRIAAVAAGCLVLGVGMLLIVPVAGELTDESVTTPTLFEPAWWLGLVLLIGQAVALLWIPTAPRVVLVGVAAAVPIAALGGIGDATSATTIAVLVVAFLAVLAAGRTRRTAWALVAAAALLGLGELIVQTSSGTTLGIAVGTGLLQGVGSLAVPVIAAVVVRARRDTRLAQHERARAITREHEALVRVAVERERTAMARELHDIAAHHLSGIAVMTGAIGRQIDTDPDAAKRAVREVREQSTAMLADLRTMVGLLRTDPVDGAVTAGTESLAGIPALVEVIRRSGIDVGLTVIEHDRGPPPVARVGPLAELSAYRTVQESLSNAATHAPGARCEVTIDASDPQTLRVTIRNDPPPQPTEPSAGPGYGLVGMRERAELTGARLDHGPTDDGGWQVSLAIPTLGDLAPVSHRQDA